MMTRFYLMFRTAGLSVAQAFAASYAAIRVAHWSDTELNDWVYLFRHMDAKACKSMRDVLRNTTIKR